MAKKRILWQILPYQIVIIFLALISFAWYASNAVKDFHRKDVSRSLEERAGIVSKHLSYRFGVLSPASVDSICDEYGGLSEMRITVIDPGGFVLGDSEEDPGKMENHSDRPEIRKALSGSVGISERYSSTLKKNFIYVAVPLEPENAIAGVVRASIPLTEVEGSLSAMYRHLFIAGAAAALIAAILSILVSRRISGPLDEMKKGIEHFGSEDLDYRIPTHGLAEVGELARVINDMASKLKNRIDMVESQKSEQEAVFQAIPDGILVLDSEERILRMNPGASSFLSITPEEAQGRLIQEVVRSQQLQRFVTETLSSDIPVEDDFILECGMESTFVQARGVTLKSVSGNGSGAVIVLNNVTRIRKLENVRKEFVANVSHELRTPVTAIRGFVETLLEGAIDSPAESKKFLSIIDRQADRMSSIISDLLLLAQVEGGEDSGNLRFENTRIREILDDARQVCSAKAQGKDIIVEIDCAEELEARANAALLEQSVVNLVENAVKYSEKGSKVTVRAFVEDGSLAIEVIDRGCGIEPDNQARLFERFFRIDKARSRKLGGTGLGLAIVKHIAGVHGGTVSVDSKFGKGSIFKIRIPLK